MCVLCNTPVFDVCICSPCRRTPSCSTLPWPPAWQAMQLTCSLSRQHPTKGNHSHSAREPCCQVRITPHVSAFLLAGVHHRPPLGSGLRSTTGDPGTCITVISSCPCAVVCNTGLRHLVKSEWLTEVTVRPCCVVLCCVVARVHPGETNSSWMMKGALQQLLADTQEAAQLRETFVFKVSTTPSVRLLTVQPSHVYAQERPGACFHIQADS